MATERTGARAARARRADGPWLSVSAAARILGVSASTLRLWASEGRVPHVRTEGGHRRFDPELLRQWLAQQPARSTRASRAGMADVKIDELTADVLREHADGICDEVDELIEGPAEVAFKRLPPPERRGVIRSWIDALADALETGSLDEAMERSEAYGRSHGLAGSSAEVTLGGSLALERAVEHALTERPGQVDAETRDDTVAAMGRLTTRVALGWASAVADPA